MAIEFSSASSASMFFDWRLLHRRLTLSDHILMGIRALMPLIVFVAVETFCAQGAFVFLLSRRPRFFVPAKCKTGIWVLLKFFDTGGPVAHSLASMRRRVGSEQLRTHHGVRCLISRSDGKFNLVPRLKISFARVLWGLCGGRIRDGFSVRVMIPEHLRGNDEWRMKKKHH